MAQNPPPLEYDRHGARLRCRTCAGSWNPRVQDDVGSRQGAEVPGHGKRDCAVRNPAGYDRNQARIAPRRNALNIASPVIVADNASKMFLDGTVVAFRQLSLQV